MRKWKQRAGALGEGRGVGTLEAEYSQEQLELFLMPASRRVLIKELNTWINNFAGKATVGDVLMATFILWNLSGYIIIGWLDMSQNPILYIVTMDLV